MLSTCSFWVQTILAIILQTGTVTSFQHRPHFKPNYEVVAIISGVTCMVALLLLFVGVAIVLRYIKIKERKEHGKSSAPANQIKPSSNGTSVNTHSSQNILLNSTSSLSIISASNADSSQVNHGYRNHFAQLEPNSSKADSSLAGNGALWITKNTNDPVKVRIRTGYSNLVYSTEHDVSEKERNGAGGRLCPRNSYKNNVDCFVSHI